MIKNYYDFFLFIKIFKIKILFKLSKKIFKINFKAYN